MGSFKVYRNKRWAWLYALSWVTFAASIGIAIVLIARSPADTEQFFAARTAWLPWAAGISLVVMIVTGRTIRVQMRTGSGGINVRTRRGWRSIAWDEIRDFDFRLEGLHQSGVIDLRDGTAIPLRWATTREPIEELTALLDVHRRPVSTEPSYETWATPAEFAPPIGSSDWYPENKSLPPTQVTNPAAGGRLGTAWGAGASTIGDVLKPFGFTGAAKKKVRNPVASAMGGLIVLVIIAVQFFSAFSDGSDPEPGATTAPPAIGFEWRTELQAGDAPTDLVADETGVVVVWQRSTGAQTRFVSRYSAGNGERGWPYDLPIHASWADIAPAPGGDFFVASDFRFKEGGVIGRYAADGTAVWSRPLNAGGHIVRPQVVSLGAGLAIAGDLIDSADPTILDGTPASVFLQGLDEQGRAEWTWRPPRGRPHEASAVRAVAATDGGDIYLATDELAQRGETWDVREQVLRRFSPDGTLEWEMDVPGGERTGIQQVVADRTGMFAIVRKATAYDEFQDSLVRWRQNGDQAWRRPYGDGFSLQDLEPTEGGDGVWVLALSPPNEDGERFSGATLWSGSGVERFEHSFWWSPGVTTQMATDADVIYLGGSLGQGQPFVGRMDERIPSNV